MALNSNNSGFGLDVEGRLKKVTDKPKDVSTHTHKPKVRERKTARIQILTYPSVVEKLDHYAKMNGLSRAEAFERAVLDFLESNT